MPRDSVIQEEPQTHEEPQPRQENTSLALLLRRVMRVLELQWRILLLQAKMTAWRMALFAGLVSLGGLVGLFALVCLWIAGFQGLAMVMPVPLAWLTYGCLHAIGAVVLILIGRRVLQGGEKR